MNPVFKYIAFIFLLALLVSCSQSVRFSSNAYSKTSPESTTRTESKPGTTNETGPDEKESVKIFRGIASYYGDKFDGRTTASGEVYDMNKLTAAHRTLKFGTKLRVTNLGNSNSVYVIVNDRGPFAEGRILDVSKAAAIILDMLQSGLAEVEIEIIE